MRKHKHVIKFTPKRCDSWNCDHRKTENIRKNGHWFASSSLPMILQDHTFSKKNTNRHWPWHQNPTSPTGDDYPPRASAEMRSNFSRTMKCTKALKECKSSGILVGVFPTTSPWLGRTVLTMDLLSVLGGSQWDGGFHLGVGGYNWQIYSTRQDLWLKMTFNGNFSCLGEKTTEMKWMLSIMIMIIEMDSEVEE